MGNECTNDERVIRYNVFHQAIYAIENDIKKEMNNPDISKKQFMPFGLVNQNICKKYDFLLKEQLDTNLAKNTIFNYKDLVKKIVNRDYSYISSKFNFGFPSNFLFITEDFLNIVNELIDKKYKNLATIFQTIIGRDCLIMKDANDKKDEKPYRYIILYNEIKENKGNEIDFFLYIKDKSTRINTDNYILKFNLFNYFKEINYNYKDEYKKIYIKDKKEIGYIVRCSDVSVIDHYISKMNSKKKNSQSNNFQNLQLNNFQGPQQNIQNNLININQNNFQNIPQVNSQQNNFPNIQQKNFQQAQQNNPGKNLQYNFNNMQQFNPQTNNDAFKKDAKSGTTITRNPYAKIYPEKFLTSAISFFFEVDKLTKFFSQNQKLDFDSFYKKLIEMLGQDIKNQTKYEQIFSEILTKLEPQNLINKEYYNQTMQYDEAKGLDSFMESHKNANIIKKLFFIPKEEKIFCEKCQMNSFQFNYSKYISLNTSNSNEFSLKLFQKDVKIKEEKYCNFCNGVKTKIKIEEIYLDFPEWLIVVIEPSIIKKINLNNFLVLKNEKKNQEYKLSMFINANSNISNILYLIREKNIIQYQCLKFNPNRLQEPEELDNKFPCVLFYHLKKISQNNNFQNLNNPNIQNQLNQNNFPNMNSMKGFQANFQQNQQNMNAFKMNNAQIKQTIIQNQQNNPMNMNQINVNQQNNAMNMNQINVNQQNNAMNMNQININQQNMIQQNNAQNMNQQFNMQNFNQQNMNFQQNLNPQLQNFNGNLKNINCGNFNQNMNNNNFPNIGNGVNQMNNMNNLQINSLNNINNMNKVGMNNNGNQMNMNINKNNLNAKTFNNNMNISNPNIMNNNINLNMMGNNLNNNMMGNNMPMNNNMLINNISSNNINNFANNNFGMNNMNNMNMMNMNNMNNMNMNNMNMMNSMNNMNMNNMNMMNNMNNMNMNNMNMMNNMNNMNMVNKMNNQNLNQLDEVPEESGDTIFITFTFIKNKRQIYLDVARSIKFREVINMLTNKYEWLKKIPNIRYSFNNSVIDKNKLDKTLFDLGIDESSDIHILSD